MLTIPKYYKYSTAVLDYRWDLSSYLETSETLSSASVTADTGLTVETVTTSASNVLAWFSGGTSKSTYRVSVNFETTPGNRKDKREIEITIF